MTTSVLVAYATKKGSTREVAEAVAATLEQHGLHVETRPAADVSDLDGYDGVVLGGALYTGRLHADARWFLGRHREALAKMPFAVFAMGPRTLAASDVAGSRQQLDHALAKVPEVEPVSAAIFGGVLDPAKQHFPLNRMPACDARDWDLICGWAEAVAVDLSAGRPAPLPGLAASLTAVSSL